MIDPFHSLAHWLRSILSLAVQQNQPLPNPSAQTQPISAEEVRIRMALKHLRQARCSFNLSLVIIAAGAVISVRGADMLLSSKTTEGTIAAVGNLLASVCHVQMVREANERLEKSVATLEDKE